MNFTTAEFSNEYEAEGSATLSAKKAANSNLGNKTFQFVLADGEGNVIETSAAVKQNQSVTFASIPYTLADAGKTYTYQIYEKLPEGVNAKNPTKDGVTYDTNVTTVDVAVIDNGDGSLSVTYNGNANPYLSRQFVRAVIVD